VSTAPKKEGMPADMPPAVIPVNFEQHDLRVSPGRGLFFHLDGIHGADVYACLTLGASFLIDDGNIVNHGNRLNRTFRHTGFTPDTFTGINFNRHPASFPDSRTVIYIPEPPIEAHKTEVYHS